jgi:hypothetical protein
VTFSFLHMARAVACHILPMTGEKRNFCRGRQEGNRYAELSKNRKEKESYQLSVFSVFLRLNFNPILGLCIITPALCITYIPFTLISKSLK